MKRDNPDVAYQVPMTTSPERLSGACTLSLVDARGWSMDVTADQLIDYIVRALGNRTIERLKVKHFFLDVPADAAAGDENV
jgi:hypothetical protein